MEVAEYPRVVVGDELLAYLETVTNQDAKTKHGEIAKQVATLCRSMTKVDTDGRPMLDFLGADAWTAMGVPFPREFVTIGHRFVESKYKEISRGRQRKARVSLLSLAPILSRRDAHDGLL